MPSCPCVLLTEAPFAILPERASTFLWQCQTGVMWSREKKQFWKKFAPLFRRHYSTDEHKQEWVPWLIVVYLLGMLHTVEDSSTLDLLIEGERQMPRLNYWQFVKGGSVLPNNYSEMLSFYTAWIGKSIYFLSMQKWWAYCSNIWEQGSACRFKYLAFLSQVLCVPWI